MKGWMVIYDLASTEFVSNLCGFHKSSESKRQWFSFGFSNPKFRATPVPEFTANWKSWILYSG
jgi:hypothetical protein